MGTSVWEEKGEGSRSSNFCKAILYIAVSIAKILFQFYSFFHVTTLVGVLILLSGFGGLIFRLIESPPEDIVIQQIIHRRNQILNQILSTPLGPDKPQAIEIMLQNYERHFISAISNGTVIVNGHSEQMWTFTGSVYFCITTFTLLGYGNLAPKTNLGRIITIIYAGISVPLSSVVLEELGGKVLSVLLYIWRSSIQICLTSKNIIRGNKGNSSKNNPNKPALFCFPRTRRDRLFICESKQQTMKTSTNFHQTGEGGCSLADHNDAGRFLEHCGGISRHTTEQGGCVSVLRNSFSFDRVKQGQCEVMFQSAEATRHRGSPMLKDAVQLKEAREKREGRNCVPVINGHHNSESYGCESSVCLQSYTGAGPEFAIHKHLTTNFEKYLEASIKPGSQEYQKEIKDCTSDDLYPTSKSASISLISKFRGDPRSGYPIYETNTSNVNRMRLRKTDFGEKCIRNFRKQTNITGSPHRSCRTGISNFVFGCFTASPLRYFVIGNALWRGLSKINGKKQRRRQKRESTLCVYNKNNCAVDFEDMEEEEDSELGDEEEEDGDDIPALLNFIILFLYITAGCVVVTRFVPSMGYLDSFWFIFISLATIGYGDVVPPNQKLFVCFIPYFFVGLCLTSNVINSLISYFNEVVENFKDIAHAVQDIFEVKRKIHKIRKKQVKAKKNWQILRNHVMDGTIPDSLIEESRRYQAGIMAKEKEFVRRAYRLYFYEVFKERSRIEISRKMRQFQSITNAEEPQDLFTTPSVMRIFKGPGEKSEIRLEVRRLNRWQRVKGFFKRGYHHARHTVSKKMKARENEKKSNRREPRKGGFHFG
ncbi:uncharacterized protein LOC101847849 [Aplysia californica]|uniref:Uncharacterized protein LOC101847849 n=1 Tax=Aplysia californica TaxID=6500 RepID=A0ABM0K8F8_APLCA|nr:uncharacterized protein LOC101847849 [Aplysia californica]